jgi:hypothetical protein
MNPPSNKPTTYSRFWVPAALLAWAGLALAICVKILVEGHGHSVYGAFVTGPRQWWSGGVMYDARGYYYSPTFSVLFTPFAILPDWLGQILWGLSSLGIFVWSLRIFYRDVMPNHWPQAMEGGFLLWTLLASLRSLWSMQSNAILMACILFAAAAIVRERWWRAGWLLAAPVFIKVWPAVAAGLFGIQWPKKLIGRLTAAALALALIPFLTKAPAAVMEYYGQWFERLSDRQVNAVRFAGYRDAWTIWSQLSDSVSPRAYAALQAGAGLAVLAWCLWLRRRSRTVQEIATYTLAAWMCWQLLFGPGTERLTYLIAAPFGAWAIITSFLERKNLWLAAIAFITTFALGAGIAERAMLSWLPASVALQPIGIIIFAAWLVRHAIVGRPWDAQADDDAVILRLPVDFEEASLRRAA